VAVFVLEGEQPVVEAFAVHVSQIIQEFGGLVQPEHHLATRRPRVPRSAAGDDTALLSVTADWSAMADLHQEITGRLEVSLLSTRFTDFFHGGCRVSWIVRESDLTAGLFGKISDILRRFGGTLVSTHSQLEEWTGSGVQDGDDFRERAKALKLQMDPSGILV